MGKIFQFKLKLHRNIINQTAAENFPLSLRFNAFLGNMTFNETSDLVFGEVLTLNHTFFI